MVSNYKLAGIILVVYGVSTFFLITESQKVEKHSADGGASCRKLMLVMAKRMMKVITNCTKEVKDRYADSADFQTHFQCTIKCFMGRVNMIDDKQMLSNATFGGFINDHLPIEFHSLTYKVIKPCLDKHEKLIDPNDIKCTAYGDFIKCLQEQASDHC